MDDQQYGSAAIHSADSVPPLFGIDYAVVTNDCAWVDEHSGGGLEVNSVFAKDGAVFVLVLLDAGRHL
jgi:hypothetical protein